MKRAQALALFGLCAAALLGVMAWLTATLRRLDEAERHGREQAALEESVRLALWRMESLVAPLVARENARRPTATLTALTPAARVASPLVRLHFQWDGRGRLFSWPRSPAPVPQTDAGASAALRAQASRLGDRQALLARLPEDWIQVEAGGVDEAAAKLRLASKLAVRKAPATPREQQQALSEGEYQARASNVAVLSGEVAPLAPLRPTEPVRVGRLEPLWLGSELVLARRVQAGQETLVQVAWLDWRELQETLLAAISDLLPEARLEPAGTEDDPGRRLAALPVRLLPGRAPAALLPDASRGRHLPLAAAWSLAALALAATGLLLSALAALGERRAAFVSAVTHELRTPLTTFRIYADMLAEGMVPPEHRGEYLETLRREAERQAHLVENVLAYSRLERGRYHAAREPLAVAGLLAELHGPLASLAARAGMELVAADLDALGDLRVVGDRSAVERILVNLVDNAARYARAAADRRIHLEVEARPESVSVLVSDHGPGLPRREPRRLFRPFHKSAGEAARSAPGVGLGLALSRRLARAVGGELRPEEWDGGGARFRLRLPRG